MDLLPYEKWLSAALLSTGALGVGIARLVWSSHPLIAIFILCTSILVFLAGIWVGSRLWIRKRTLLAIGFGIVTIMLCGLWAHDERTRTAQQAPSAPPSVQQTTPGNGSAAVNGSGNTVTTNAPKSESGDKK
jgi:hypothetical protein